MSCEGNCMHLLFVLLLWINRSLALSSPLFSVHSFVIERYDEEIHVRNGHNPRTKSVPGTDRRFFLSRSASSYFVAGSTLIYPAAKANALPFIGGPERRQLELCLLYILRTEYWGINVANSLKTKLLSHGTINTNEKDTNSTDAINRPLELSENQRKQPYLEARLGAKALLTQKIGGGANSKVMDLGGFQLKECLKDAEYWCGELAKRNQLPCQLTGGTSTKNAKRICSNDLSLAVEELLESLASIVEFDGLETTIDPSPRSSLMLNMYNRQKGTFVYRTLVERVVPSCERCINVFGRERRAAVEDYLRRDYGNEIPFEVLQESYGR